MQEIERKEILQWEEKAAERLLNATTYEQRRKLYSAIYNKDNLFWLKKHGDMGISGQSAQDHLLLKAAFPGNGPILDVGGGIGIAGYAFPEATIYIVCDASLESLYFTAHKNDSRAKMKAAGYATELPFRDRTFEGVLLLDVMEHLHPDDIEVCLKEIKRVMRPGGRLLISTPNRLSGPWDMRRDYPERWNNHGLHICEMTVCQIIKLLTGHGFHPLAFQMKSYQGWLFHLRPLLLWATLWENLMRLVPWKERPRFCEISIVVANLPLSKKEPKA
jgi:SAM-dependent methyltransferase